MAESTSRIDPTGATGPRGATDPSTGPADGIAPPAPGQGKDAGASAAESKPHNFDVQKELHRRIRNDPDYDDWEYGTEPLPHELGGWVARPAPPAGSENPAAPGMGVETP